MHEHANPSKAPGTIRAEVLKQLLAERFSCRGYLSDPVPDVVIADIFDTARLSASWCNTQPWHMVVTRPGSTEPFARALTEQALAATEVDADLAFPPEYREEFLNRRRAAGFALYDAVGVGRKDSEGRKRQAMENFRFFGAPHVAILTTAAELGPYGAVDCGGFLSCFLLAARAHGVATIAQAAIAQHSSFIRDYFGIPATRHVICGVSFGYADMSHPANSFRTERRGGSDLYRFA
jgi:nitroreductase